MVVGGTSLDLAWSTILYFLIILGTASGVLVWYAARVLSVRLLSNNVGLTNLNQERMWQRWSFLLFSYLCRRSNSVVCHSVFFVFVLLSCTALSVKRQATKHVGMWEWEMCSVAL